MDSFLPSSYPDSLGSNVHSVDLGLQFQDFAYTIDSSLESLTFAFASTDYPEVIGIDSVMITGDPACTDADGDGYYPETGCLEPLDCNDANKNIYSTNPNIYCDCQGEIQQGVTENCTGGVDEDCDGLVDDADPECGGGTCVGSAVASTYEASQVYGFSDLVNHFTLLLFPAGAILLLRIRRRKTQ